MFGRRGFPTWVFQSGLVWINHRAFGSQPNGHPRIVSFLSGAHIQATTSASQSVVAFAEPVGHRPQLSFDQSSHDLGIRAGHRPQLSFDQSSHDLVILARQL
jgi:hypothetical protein